MPDDDNLGLMSSCHRCGGENARTGKQRIGPPERMGFGRATHRRRTEEYRCGSCGATVWAETTPVDERSE